MIACVVRSASLRTTVLALMLLAVPAGAANAASGTVMQVRVDGKLRCSATLVAPQYVLTARHCVRPVAVKRLRIVAGSGTFRVAKAATVLSAPRVSGRRPDLALVQLTSNSALPVARLRGRSTYRLPTSGAVTARGWKTTKASRTAKGTLRKSRSCGSVARRSGLICARLSRSAPAPRCKDAAGAALTTRRKPVLLGVGTRGAQNCRRPARASFEPVTGARIQSWVTSAIAPAAAVPSPAPAADPLAVYLGNWQGVVSQDIAGNTKSYYTKVTIDRTGPVGQAIGSSGYGENATGCGGALDLLNTDGLQLTMTERLTYGQAYCIDGGTMHLAKVNGQDALAYSWTRGPEDGRSSGVLQRVG